MFPFSTARVFQVVAPQDKKSLNISLIWKNDYPKDLSFSFAILGLDEKENYIHANVYSQNSEDETLSEFLQSKGILAPYTNVMALQSEEQQNGWIKRFFLIFYLCSYFFFLIGFFFHVGAVQI